jgi:hypothetical protein
MQAIFADILDFETKGISQHNRQQYITLLQLAANKDPLNAQVLTKLAN